MNQKELGNMLIKMGEALLNDRERDSEVQCAAISWDYVHTVDEVKSGAVTTTTHADYIELRVRQQFIDRPDDAAVKLARIAGKDANGVKLGGETVEAREYPSGIATVEGACPESPYKYHANFAVPLPSEEHDIINMIREAKRVWFGGELVIDRTGGDK